MKRYIFVILAFLTLAALGGDAQAGRRKSTLVFTWTANSEPDLAGYVFYERIGTEHIPLAVIEPSPKPSYVLGTVSKGFHYYTVTAYNTEGFESDFSREVVYLARKLR